MLGVLDSACQGGMKYGIFWTVWKLCQGLASLSVNDKNKEMITSKVRCSRGLSGCSGGKRMRRVAHDVCGLRQHGKRIPYLSSQCADTLLFSCMFSPCLSRTPLHVTAQGGVDILAEVVMGKHHNQETAHRFALSALWNLAFNERSKAVIINTPGLVDSIRTLLSSSESPKTREVAKGALWTLGGCLGQGGAQGWPFACASLLGSASQTSNRRALVVRVLVDGQARYVYVYAHVHR